MKALIEQLMVPGAIDEVAKALMPILASPAYGGDRGTAITELVEAYEEVVFDPKHIQNDTRLGPYLRLLVHKFPDEQAHLEFKRKVIQKVLGHMTKKRAIDAARHDILLQAEAFANLVALDCVQLEGAMQTIERLIGKPDSRAAAVTMLGKTVDLCIDKFTAIPNDPKYTEPMRKLWIAMDAVQEPVFQYDIAFISAQRERIIARLAQLHGPAIIPALTAAPPAAAPPMPMPVPTPMGGPPGVSAPGGIPTPMPVPVPTPAPASSQGPVHVKQLRAMRGLPDIQSLVFSFNWDAVTRHALTASQDGCLRFYDGAASLRNTIPFHSHYVTAIDSFTRAGSRMFVASAVPNNAQLSGNNCAVALFDGTTYQQTAMAQRATTMISSLRTLPPNSVVEGWVTAEAAPNTPMQPTVVCVYDAARVGASNEITPVLTLAEHSDMITAIAASSSHANIFMTASSDATLRIWDMRAPKSVGMFGVPSPTGGRYAHQAPVAHLDAMGDTVLSTGRDNHINIWDIRQLGAVSAGEHYHGLVAGYAASLLVEQPEHMIYKLAYANSPSPTVAAFVCDTALFLLDWTNSLQTPSVTPAVDNPNLPYKLKYIDCKWTPGAGENGGPALYGVATPYDAGNGQPPFQAVSIFEALAA